MKKSTEHKKNPAMCVELYVYVWHNQNNKKVNYCFHLGLSRGNGLVLWTGLNSLDDSSGWHWINGQPLRYLNWLSGEYFAALYNPFWSKLARP